MAATYNFPKIVRGDTFKARKIRFEKNGTPIDLTGATIAFQLKKRETSSADHTFDYTITNAELGEIELHAFTVDIPAWEYVYDFRIEVGSKLTYMRGKFPVIQNRSEWQ